MLIAAFLPRALPPAVRGEEDDDDDAPAMSAKLYIDAALRDSVPSNTSGLLLGTEKPHVRILQLVPTPTTPPQTSPHKWALEHAKLLATMLPGGVSILGAYTPLTQTNSVTPTAQIEAAARIVRDVAGFVNCETPLVLFSGVKGRLSAKVVHSMKDGLKNATLKELPHLNHGLVSLRGAFDVAPIHVPVRDTSDKLHLEIVCAELLKRRFQNALMCINADKPHIIANTNSHTQTTLATALNWPVVETGKKKTLSFTCQEPLQVRLYLPLHTSEQREQPDIPANQTVSLSGRFWFDAVVMQDASLSDALCAVRHDLCTSLQARLQLLHDDDHHHDSIQQDSTPSSRALPVRVVATPLEHAPLRIPFCDYMMRGETVQHDVTDRLVEILSWTSSTLKEYCIEEKEQPARVLPAVKKVTFKEHATLIEPSSMTRLDAAANAPSDMLVNAIIFAVVVAVVAIVVKELILGFI
ncbi:hypothetical protein BWQ96_00784 [Gracilariopsis chorda]|uniref:Protein odr-4-like n=1 Tax=Gracilariopsis chorda TaxID=448386 RepID=A0A2V3J4V7_9FLOR|nr:hypothetical protein BWQ96_00784 [Gracilariopsis chorda]|eukprot:PXF49468.1 hypothetical protein BWQ96_00784 [Gracilariopsis chorda]